MMDPLYDIVDLKLTPNVTARQKREYWRASLHDKSRKESSSSSSVSIIENASDINKEHKSNVSSNIAVPAVTVTTPATASTTCTSSFSSNFSIFSHPNSSAPSSRICVSSSNNKNDTDKDWNTSNSVNIRPTIPQTKFVEEPFKATLKADSSSRATSLFFSDSFSTSSTSTPTSTSVSILKTSPICSSSASPPDSSISFPKSPPLSILSSSSQVSSLKSFPQSTFTSSCSKTFSLSTSVSSGLSPILSSKPAQTVTATAATITTTPSPSPRIRKTSKLEKIQKLVETETNNVFLNNRKPIIENECFGKVSNLDFSSTTVTSLSSNQTAINSLTKVINSVPNTVLPTTTLQTQEYSNSKIILNDKQNVQCNESESQSPDASQKKAEYSIPKKPDFEKIRKISLTNSFSSSPNDSTMNNQQIENEFQNLSLIFRTDSSTIRERSKLIKHQHRIADKDLNSEMSELKSQINSLKNLIIDSSFTNGPKIFSSLARIQQQTDIIEDGIHRLALKSELSGSVSYELKMMNAFSVAQLHVDNLKRAKERDERELEDIKRLLCLPNEQNSSSSPHDKTSSFWLNQEKPMDQFEENILKLATNSATPITAAAASKINFIRLRRASVASMDYQSKEITRRSRVFKPELKILRQSDNSTDSENKDKPETSPETSCNNQENQELKLSNFKLYGNNFKDLCKKYRDKLTETWIEEEQNDEQGQNCCQNFDKKPILSSTNSSPLLLSSSSSSSTSSSSSSSSSTPASLSSMFPTSQSTQKSITNDDNESGSMINNENNLQSEKSFTNAVSWFLKIVFNFFCEKNRFYFVEIMKFAENMDAINSQEDFVQLRYLVAAFLLFVSFMLFLWNILLPFMV